MAPTRTRVWNSWWRESESGTTAIEFGLLIPILLVLVAITAELGIAMHESMQVNNAVEAGMLYATKNGFDVPGITNAVINATGTPGITATPAPTFCYGCPSASGVTMMDCNSPSLCADGKPAGQYVQIHATIGHVAVLPNFGLPVPTTLTAQSIVRLH